MTQPSKRNIILFDAIRALDNAITAHTLWLSEFHRGVICDTAPAPSVVAADSHLHCVFGRWYHDLDRGEWQQWSADLDQPQARRQFCGEVDRDGTAVGQRPVDGGGNGCRCVDHEEVAGVEKLR